MMSYCESCGAELEPGSALCAKCGAAVRTGGEAQAGLPAADAPAGVAPPPPAGPPASPPPEATGSRYKALLIALAAVAAVGVAVVLVLGFAVGPKWFVSKKGGETASGSTGGEVVDPEQVVRAFYDAMQKGDAAAMVALVEAGNRKQLDDFAKANGFPDGEALLADYINTAFPLKDLLVTGLKMETDIKGDAATVRITSGKAVYTGPGGKKVEESYSDGGNVFGDAGFDLVKKNGRWYLALELAGSGQGGGQSGDGQGGGQSNGGQSGGGTFTGKSEPEKVVDNYFRAMETKDARLLLSTFSPSSIAELQGQLSEVGYTSIEDFFKEFFFSSYQSIEFQGIKYQTTIDGDKAVVKVLEGKALIVDENGNATTEDVLDAEVPVEIPMVREGGTWYIDFMSMGG
jgi:hypothetical protein